MKQASILLFLWIFIPLAGCKDNTSSIGTIKQFTGQMSGITTPEYYLVSSEAEQEHLRSKKLGVYYTVTPPLDFRKEMCLVVFIGERTNTTDGTIWTEIKEELDRIIFRIDVRPPLQLYVKGEITSGGVIKLEDPGYIQTTPFCYFSIPRTTKKIIIEEAVDEVQQDKGKSGVELKWVVRKEFTP